MHFAFGVFAGVFLQVHRKIARQERAMNCPTTNRITYKLNIEELLGVLKILPIDA